MRAVQGSDLTYCVTLPGMGFQLGRVEEYGQNLSLRADVLLDFDRTHRTDLVGRAGDPFKDGGRARGSDQTVSSLWRAIF